jgi:hypothetical protein
MTIRKAVLAAALALAAPVALLGSAPATVTHAAAGTVLVSGQLRDAAGNPAAGSVQVYAWPLHDSAITLPLVGQAQSDGAGNFTVVATDPGKLAQLARQRDGWLDFIAVGDTPGHEGQWTFTSYIDTAGAAVRSLDPDSVSAQGLSAAIASAGHAPRIRIDAKQKVAAHTAQYGSCDNQRHAKAPEKSSAWAIVGELNNAYNDGTSASFTYSREQTADTSFGVAMSSDGGDTWSIGGTTHVGDKGSLSFPTVTSRYARKLKTKFEFTKEQVRATSCAPWSVYVRATSWLLGTDSSTKQNGTLDKCDSSWVGGDNSGVNFTRNRNDAVRWNNGAVAFGVEITTQSGFSKDVSTVYKFGGPPSKKHYLCGPDGRESPVTAGRIFSGARK